MKNLREDQGAGNPRAASVRIGSKTVSGYSSQRRHDLRIGAQPGYIDPSRSDLNRVLIDCPGPAAMRQIARDRRAARHTKRAAKSSAAIATAGVITFGSEAAAMFEQLTPAAQDAAFLDLAEAVAARLNTSLHGLVVHLDESTIHAHFTLCGYDRDGHPLSKSTRPGILSELQDLTAEVMGRHCSGIERGHRYGDRLAAGANWADVVHRSVHELHRDLPRDLAAKRAELGQLAEAEAAAAARVDEMRGRVLKLRQQGELTAKEVKRLAIYEKRLMDRIAGLESAHAAAEKAQAEAEKLQEAVAALADEIEGETLRLSSAGKIIAANPDKLRPAMKILGPSVRAVAAARTKIDQDRAEVAQDRAHLDDQIEQTQGLQRMLRTLIRRVSGWLALPDLTEEARRDAERLLERSNPLLPPPEEASEEAAGPGL